MKTNKVLVVGNVNKYQQTLLDKMQECGYEIVYAEIGDKVKGLVEFDFLLFDGLLEKVSVQFKDFNK